MPIIYKQTQGPTDDETWLSSTDPLPKGLELFLKDHGGIPEESPIPFSLSSLFSQHAFNVIHANELRITILKTSLLTLCIACVMTIIFLCRLWKKYAPNDLKSSWLSLIIVVVIGSPFFFIVWACGFTSFTAYDFPKEERIAMVNEAVSKNEVSGEAAKISRKYLDKIYKESK